MARGYSINFFLRIFQVERGSGSTIASVRLQSALLQAKDRARGSRALYHKRIRRFAYGGSSKRLPPRRSGVMLAKLGPYQKGRAFVFASYSPAVSQQGVCFLWLERNTGRWTTWIVGIRNICFAGMSQDNNRQRFFLRASLGYSQCDACFHSADRFTFLPLPLPLPPLSTCTSRCQRYVPKGRVGYLRYLLPNSGVFAATVEQWCRILPAHLILGLLPKRPTHPSPDRGNQTR